MNEKVDIKVDMVHGTHAATTEKEAWERLGIAKDMDNNYGVHAAHCCKWHGCKYGDDDCPVVTGKVEQKYLCEYCYEDLDGEEYYRKALNNIEEMKMFLIKKYD